VAGARRDPPPRFRGNPLGRLTSDASTEIRARLSEGTSDSAIYAVVAHALGAREARGTVVDLGCGSGRLRAHLGELASRYIGVDAVRYEGFPAAAQFLPCDLESGAVPLPDGAADIAVAVEVIEHLENPRALVRELTRLARPGGWIAVTTPNQLSALSLATLAVKHRFSAFQDVHYPAHRTALLEVDLQRIARECALSDATCEFTLRGRIPLTPWQWPRLLSRVFPRALSDNILLIARKPGQEGGDRGR
jgi:2-polyprenyl-3-methyl-5-hydroxy-6-metoxy-1,4-benzoquinol methylase